MTLDADAAAKPIDGGREVSVTGSRRTLAAILRMIRAHAHEINGLNEWSTRAETFVDGETVNCVACRHNISRSMLFGWRKHYCETLGFAAPASTPKGFTPVAVTRSEPSKPAMSLRAIVAAGFAGIFCTSCNLIGQLVS